MRTTLATTVIYALLTGLFAASGAAERVQLVRVPIHGQSDLDLLLSRGLDVTAVHSRSEGADTGTGRAAVDLVVRRGERRLLRRLGFKVRLLSNDLEHDLAAGLGPPPLAAVSAPPNFGTGAQGGYYTFGEIVGLLDHYAQTYPQIVAPKIAIGTSVKGRPLWAIKVSDNPAQAESEPRILIDSLHHAREPMSVQTLLYLLHHLCAGYGVDPEITDLVNGREIWLVPVVNPDGYVFNENQNPAGGGMWRKNRSLAGGCVGVDLNRNYSSHWAHDDYGSSGDPCSELYRGSAPLSEPESAAMDALVASLGCEVVCTLHAHGELLLQPLGYQEALPADEPMYRSHGEELVGLNGYRTGTVAELLVPANGNALDHHHLAHGAEAWAFEIGTSFWPPLAEMVPVADANLRPLLRLIRFAGAWLEPVSFSIDDPAGNGNGFADPGEQVELRLTLENRGHRSSGPVSVTLSSSDPAVTVLNGSGSAAAVGSFDTRTTTSAVATVQLSTGAEPGRPVALSVTLDWKDFSVTTTLSLEIGTRRLIGLDDLESDLGWRAGMPGDDAFTGKWIRDEPDFVQHGVRTAQPDHDTTASPGNQCFITGNGGAAPGQDDVDDGRTTLRSPRFSLLDTVGARIRYQRFYWCSGADNPFTIELSNDDGATWTTLEAVSGRPNEWRQREWRVEDFLAPTDLMRLRFIAEDPLNNSVTEALMDDFEIVDHGGQPHLLLMGESAIGGQVQIQLAGAPSARTVVFAAFGTGITPLPGIGGQLGLDLPSLRLIADTRLGPDGFARLPMGVPNDVLLIGTSVYLQSLELGAVLTFGNVTEVVFQYP